MARVVSIWLPSWRTDRIETRAKDSIGLPEAEPKALAVIVTGKGGKCILALNRCAEKEGLRIGMLLTDACTLLPSLATIPYEAEAERRELKRLAIACNCFSPWVAPDEPDGLWIEATGLAHLFGGEQALLDQILDDLRRLGFEARGAIAGTAGAAWALARFAKATSAVAPQGDEAERLRPCRSRRSVSMRRAWRCSKGWD
jgi:protein ImuB